MLPVITHSSPSLTASVVNIFGSDPAVNAEKAAQSFVTDSVDMAHAGIETLIYGPGSWHYEPDEYIDIDEMTDAARVYLAAARRHREDREVRRRAVRVEVGHPVRHVGRSGWPGRRGGLDHRRVQGGEPVPGARRLDRLDEDAEAH